MWGCCNNQLFNMFNSLFKKDEIKMLFFTFKIEYVTILQKQKRILTSIGKGNIQRKISERWKIQCKNKKEQARGRERNWGESPAYSVEKEKEVGAWGGCHEVMVPAPRGRSGEIPHESLWHDRCLLKWHAGAKAKTMKFKDLDSDLDSSLAVCS